MLFNSYIFILIFLPLCLIGYFILNRLKKYKLAMAFLFIMSLWFYGYFNYNYLLIIIISIVFNYIIYFSFQNIQNNIKRKMLLCIGLIFNIGLIFYFKYFNFFIDNINLIFKTSFNLKNILLPLGISFFTFQQLSFVIDSYKKEVPRYSFLDYASFVTFFPQLIAGPIVTHDELIPQFMDKKKKKFNWENFVKGIYIFTLGLSKKILIADIFGNVVNYGFSTIATLNTTDAFIVMLSYTIQIYFDFSGYCDMALGLGKMMNIDLPINFDSPYKCLTIVEFWKRWHITLTRFFTKYIYIPLGGNRKGKIRAYVNTIVVFLASGLWHGANWTFIVWGLLHGIFLIITKHFKKWFERMHSALSWIITFCFINITWIIFRADTLHDAIQLINKLILFKFGPINSNIYNCFNLSEFTMVFNNLNPKILQYYPCIFLMLYFVFVLCITLNCKNSYEKMKEFKPSYRKLFTIVILLVWCIISFTSISTFLYFNF